jgi:hypothetical protein
MDYARAATLINEIERYLTVVELFRAEDCAPQWRPEPHTRARRSGAVRSRGLASLKPIERKSR